MPKPGQQRRACTGGPEKLPTSPGRLCPLKGCTWPAGCAQGVRLCPSRCWSRATLTVINLSTSSRSVPESNSARLICRGKVVKHGGAARFWCCGCLIPPRLTSWCSSAHLDRSAAPPLSSADREASDMGSRGFDRAESRSQRFHTAMFAWNGWDSYHSVRHADGCSTGQDGRKESTGYLVCIRLVGERLLHHSHSPVELRADHPRPAHVRRCGEAFNKYAILIV